MFTARVEQESRSRLHDQPAEQRGKQFLGDRKLALQFRPVERVQRVMVECDRDAFVTQLGDDLQRVFEPVVGEAVRVVAEEQVAHGTASRNCTSGKRDRSSCSRPEIRNVIVAGQLEQVPPKRTWAMPSDTSTTSSSVPSISRAGATSSRTTRATRSFKSALMR